MLKMSTCTNSSFHLPRNVCGVVHGMIYRLLVEFDDVLSTALVDSYVKHGDIGYARAVFDMMLEKNVFCTTSMITGYMKRGSMGDAEEIFHATIEKDIVVYNAMIEGYSKLKEYAERSVKIFIEMQRASFQPNISTFASVIGACALSTSYEIGEQVQAQIMRSPLFFNIKIGSALVDMYAKYGRVDDAWRIFDSMPNKNVFSWSSMIDGFGKNGEPHKALDLLKKMGERHVKPNSVTFLGALSACAHAGLVDQGREIFERMERDYLVRPSMEHYACMVDLLGRAGSVYDAWEFVTGMQEKPNEDVWAALLSTCRLYGEVEMARIAANELFKLRADGRPGAYVALSNTLADAGKWDNVIELREMMKVRGISKGGACSSVGAQRG
ncbi:hypothetical protein MLD38_037082 [Melastoma candidum]|nr:hypothetical protein MLD38_037082 [Melastoma candidum]